MPVVGDASVVVRAITDKVKGDIEKSFRDARPAVQAAGKDHAKAYSDSFSAQLNSSMSKTMGDSFKSPQTNSAASQAGKDNAKAYAGSFGSELSRLDLGAAMKRGLGGLTDEAGDAGREAGEKAGEEAGDAAERSFGGAGGRGGRAFRNALDGEFARAAQSATRSFTMIYSAGQILGPAVAGLVSTLSAAVSGLYAMASAASVAAGSLAVLPGAVSVAAQSFGALKLAFTGVGDAVTAGLKPVPATAAAAGRSAAAAANAIADAQRNLGRARQDAAEAASDAARRVADAERDVADAQRDTLALTKALTQARLDAKESLQQLAFSVEEAGLAERRAGINLEEAYQKLVTLQNTKPSEDLTAEALAQQQREAQLAYEEAELSYREAKDRNADLQKEQAKSAAAGIKGSKEVTDAQNDINDAKQTQADKEQALADARLAQARQAQDSAQAIADAERALLRAKQQSTAATTAGTKAVNAYAEAMKKLSPEAQTFVRYLISLKDELAAVRAAAGQELFPKLQDSLEPIVNQIFPILERELRTTGGLLGDAALGFSRAITSAEGMGRVQSILSGNNEILRVFTERGEDGRNTFDKLGIVLLRLLDAVQPITNRFAKFIAGLVDAAEAATDTRKEMNTLTGFFDTAGDRAALLGSILHNIWDVLVNIGKAADDSGTSLLESFDKATEKLADFTGKKSTQNDLKQYFDDVADNLRDIGDLVVAIGYEFGKLGDNKGVGNLATSLIPAVENLGSIGDKLTTASPALGRFAEQITRVIDAFTDSGSVEIFLNILSGVADALADIAESPVGRKVLLIVGSVAAVTRAFSLLAIIGAFAFKVLVGGPIRVVNSIRSIGRILGNMRRAFQEIRRGNFRQAFVEIGRGSDQAKAAFERQMKTDTRKVAAMKAVEEQADKTAFALLRAKDAGAPGVGAAASPARGPVAAAGSKAAAPAVGVGGAVAAKNVEKIGASAGKSAGGISKFGKALSGLSLALLGVTGPVALVIAAIAALIGFFILLYKHSPQFKKFIDGIVGKVKELGQWIGEIFTKYVFPAFDKFFGWVNENLPKAGAIISDVFMNYVVPVLKVFWTIWSTYFTLIFDAYTKVFEGIRWVVMNVFVPLITNVIIPYVKLLWTVWSTYFNLLWDVAKTIFNLVSQGFQLLWAGIKLYINNVVRPIFGVIKSLFDAWWTTVKNVAGWIKDAFVAIKDKLVAVKNLMSPVITAIQGFFSGLWDSLKDAAGKIAGKFDDIVQWVKDLKTKLTDPIDKVKGLFTGIASAVASAFEDVLEGIKKPIREIINFLNDNLIGPLNSVTSKFGLDIKKIPVGFEKGGYTGPGNPKKVAGVVHADEHVIRAVSRRKLERQFPGALEHMNRTGMIPRAAIPMGDWGPLGAIAGAVSDKASGAWNSFENLAKEGVGKALGNMVNGLEAAMKAAGFKPNDFINQFVYGVLDKLGKAVGSWGDEKQKEAEAKIAPKGGDTHVNDPSNPAARSTWKGGTFSNLFIAHMKAAEKIAGATIQVIQGGFRPATPYSGTSHQGDAIDMQVNYALLRALRKVGIAAGDRTGLGNWGPHIHAIPGPSAGYAAGSAIWQWLDYMAKGGMNQSPRSTWGLAQGGVALARPGGVHAVIAEAGRNERVEPLDPNGMSKRDQYMIDKLDQLMGEGNSSDNFHIYPSQGMDEAALAAMVSRRVAWRKSVGT